MDEGSLIEKIIQFGLSRQEASVYVCLLKNGELTGYEVSKNTGISRSNVYNALASLVEHGAAYVMECNTSKYVAVELGEFCDNRIRYLCEVKKVLLENAPHKTAMAEGYITIEGYRHILDKIHHMLTGAGQRIYFSASVEFIELWKAELLSLAERKIKIVLITDSEPEGIPSEYILMYKSYDSSTEWEEKDRQLRLIIDSAYVLTGEITGGTSDTCLYSTQRNLVNVFKEAMSNEIRLIELKMNHTDEGQAAGAEPAIQAERDLNGKESICNERDD